MDNKFLSRKFIAFLAAFCASLGGSLCGAFSGNTTIIIVGMIMTALAAGFYQLAESRVDAANAASNTTTKTVTATTDNSAIVKNVLTNNEQNKN